MITALVKERPIIFSGEMVRAIQDKRKTQTRRVIKPQPYDKFGLVYTNTFGWMDRALEHNSGRFRKCPYGKPGDRLWVRETWGHTTKVNDIDNWPGRPHKILDPSNKNDVAIYRADGEWSWLDEDGYSAEYSEKKFSYWKPSIFMPRKFSRINLLIKDIRVERVQDISGDDAEAEGIYIESRATGGDDYIGVYRDYSKPFIDSEYPWFEDDPISSFKTLWNKLNEKRGYGWDKNPWVWVIDFEVEK